MVRLITLTRARQWHQLTGRGAICGLEKAVTKGTFHKPVTALEFVHVHPYQD